MLRWRWVEVSGGFLLVLAMLYYWDGQGILIWALAACGVHELGHWAAIRLLGGRVTLLRLTCVGAEMRLSARYPLSWGRQLLAALAGPAVSLLTAWAAARMAGGREALFLFAGLNLALGLFNLLPAALMHSEGLAGRMVRFSTMAGSLFLAACSAVLFVRGTFNLTLILAALWLSISQISPIGPGKRGKKR